MIRWIVALGLALCFVGCRPIQIVETPTKTSDVKVVKVWFDSDKRQAWVLKRATKTESNVIVSYEKAPVRGKRVVSTNIVPVHRSEQDELWLCYRDPRKSQPQCYRAAWSESEDEAPAACEDCPVPAPQSKPADAPANPNGAVDPFRRKGARSR